MVGGGPEEDGGAPELCADGGVVVGQHLGDGVVLVSVSEGLGGALLQLYELVAWRCGQRVLGCGGLEVGELVVLLEPGLHLLDVVAEEVRAEVREGGEGRR